MRTAFCGILIAVVTSICLLPIGCGHASRSGARPKPLDRAKMRTRGELSVHPTAALTLHITDATGCAAVDPDTFTCSSVDITGDAGVDQSIYVFATGVDSLEGVDFGVEYPPSVTLIAWVDCIRGGGTIASRTWPESGSSVARAFGRCEASRGDGFILLGYFRVRAGSVGSFGVTPSPSAASIATCRLGTWAISDSCGFGRVDVGGRGRTPPHNPCGPCDD